MTEEARACRNEYRRKWYSKNKDRVKEQQERYWQRKVAAKKEAAAKESAQQPA